MSEAGFHRGMELRTNAGVAAAGLVAAFGIWASALGGWRTDPIRSILLEPGADKIAHVVLYAALTLVLGLAIERIALKSAWVIGPMLAWGIGVADELRQAGERGRDASVEDLVANGVGITAVALILFLRRPR